jgi:FkbM family methyltransferase
MLNLLKLLIKPLVGTGIGRIKPIAKLYQAVLPRIIGNRTLDIQGFKINISAGNHITDIGTELMFKGIHEPATTRLFKSVLKPGNTVIDIGANIGYFSLLSANLVGSAGHVIAIEPDPDNAIALSANIKLNGFKNIEIQQIAVSNTTGIAAFYRHKNEDARHSLIKSDQDSSIPVKLNTLDRMIPLSKPVDLIKTDTEGNDMAVLLGARKILEKNNVMVITELYKEMLEASGYSIAVLWNYLVSVGFARFFLIDDYDDSVTLCPDPDYIEEMYNKSEPGLNLFCIKGKK